MAETFSFDPISWKLSADGPHVTIKELNLGDDAELSQYLEVANTEIKEFQKGISRSTVEQYRGRLAADTAFKKQSLVAVVESLEGAQLVVASADLVFPQLENKDMVSLSTYVVPQWRNHGIGSALLQAAYEVMKQLGRTKVTAYAWTKADEDPKDTQLPFNRLAQKHSIKAVATEELSVVKIPLDRDLVEDLNLEVEAALGKYRLLIWEDEVPEDYLEQYVGLLNQFEKEIPMEDSALEEQVNSPERVRNFEAVLRAANRHQVISAALSPNGKLAGMSSVVYRDNGSTLATQEETIVLREHQGNKLGIGMKLATHRMVHEVAPDIAYISTYNNHSNEHMLRINHRMGYQLTSREIELTGEIPQD